MAFTERYVTTTGAGGHTGVDAANAWDLAEALTSAAAGHRVNIQSDAGYSLGADAVTNPGTTASAIVFRGYNSAIGDLEGQGRNADGTLNTTNFPVITLTGTLTPHNYIVFEALNFTGSINSWMIGSGSVDFYSMIQCKILNTANNASALCVLGDNNINLLNCDFECSGASHDAVIQSDTHFHVIGCRVKSTAATHILIDNGLVLDTVIHGATTSVGIDINGNKGFSTTIMGCTIYDVGVAIRTGNFVPNYPNKYINNHVTDCAELLNNQYSGTANEFAIEINNRTRDNTIERTGIGDGVLVEEITTDTGGAETDFVNAGAENFRLISAAPGKAAGMVAYNDCGALQRQEAGGDITVSTVQATIVCPVDVVPY